jgi:hypothetical protein
MLERHRQMADDDPLPKILHLLDVVQWLNDVAARVRDRLTAIEILQLEPETLTLAYGLRCVVLNANGEQALLSPSVSVGGAVASRPEDRVQHLEIQQYEINDARVDVAAEAAVAHLGGQAAISAAACGGIAR